MALDCHNVHMVERKKSSVQLQVNRLNVIGEIVSTTVCLVFLFSLNGLRNSKDKKKKITEIRSIDTLDGPDPILVFSVIVFLFDFYLFRRSVTPR